MGLQSFAKLLAITGPLDRFATPAKLWKFVGLHLVDGHAARREKGMPWTHTDCTGKHKRNCKDDCTTDHHPHCVPGVQGTSFSPKSRTIGYLMGESIVKSGGGGPWRSAYDFKKSEYLDRTGVGPSNCIFAWEHKNGKGQIFQCGAAHIHAAARRYAVKQLLKAMWHEWHAVMPAS